VLVAGFTRPVLERARFGPPTPTRARRLSAASVDPTEAPFDAFKGVVCVRPPARRAGPKAAPPSQVGNPTDLAASYAPSQTGVSAIPSRAAALTVLKEYVQEETGRSNQHGIMDLCCPTAVRSDSLLRQAQASGDFSHVVGAFLGPRTDSSRPTPGYRRRARTPPSESSERLP
jgi:hypothetical protein